MVSQLEKNLSHLMLNFCVAIYYSQYISRMQCNPHTKFSGTIKVLLLNCIVQKIQYFLDTCV